MGGGAAEILDGEVARILGFDGVSEIVRNDPGPSDGAILQSDPVGVANADPRRAVRFDFGHHFGRSIVVDATRIFCRSSKGHIDIVQRDVADAGAAKTFDANAVFRPSTHILHEHVADRADLGPALRGMAVKEIASPRPHQGAL